MNERKRGAPSATETIEAAGYQTLSVLGQGGMGTVLLVEKDGVRYALKCIHEELAKDAGLLDRTRLEAESLLAIAHPNVVRCHHVGRSGDTPYIVMELLDGVGLDVELKKRGKIPVQEALGWMVQILDGLSAIHAQGLVHRDMKPANVFLLNGPHPRTVKVTDLGIAKVISDRAGGVRPLETPTEAGQLIGTPRWCSPEAFYSDPSVFTVKSDLYSVGLMLHYALSGTLPWAGASSEVDLATAQVTKFLPPLGGELAWLDPIIAKLTAKKAVDRYGSAQEVRQLLVQGLHRAPDGELTTDPLSIRKLEAALPNSPEKQRPVGTMVLDTNSPEFAQAAPRQEPQLAQGIARQESQLAQGIARQESQLAQGIARQESQLAQGVARQEQQQAATAHAPQFGPAPGVFQMNAPAVATMVAEPMAWAQAANGAAHGPLNGPLNGAANGPANAGALGAVAPGGPPARTVLADLGSSGLGAPRPAAAPLPTIPAAPPARAPFVKAAPASSGRGVTILLWAICAVLGIAILMMSLWLLGVTA